MNRKRLTTLACFVWACLLGLHAQTDSTFFLQGANGRLAARMQLPEQQPGKRCHVVILCHGFGGSMDNPLFDQIARNLLNGGVGVVRFDFNGHGRSEGKFRHMTVPNEIEDARAVATWASQQPRTKDISLLGHSQGGVVAAMAAGQLGRKAVKALVLLAPAAVLRDDALRGNTMGAAYDPWNAPEFVRLPFGKELGREYIQSALTLPIYETAARYKGPTLVLHGQADRVVPYTYGERFQQVMPKASFELIPGEDHGFSADTPRAAAIAANWLLQKLH